MGCGGSKEGGGGPVDTAADIASQKLTKELEEQQAQENAIIKLLVLGTGESGKSTVFKQMKILYSVPDPPHKFIMICRANLFGNAKQVAEGMQRLGIEFKSDAGKKAAKDLESTPADGNVDNAAEWVEPLQAMFQDAGVKEAIERANEFQLNDSTIYFWERTAELLQADYMPNEQDVLRARVRTTGIVQQNFQIGEKKYTMFDVGGQRNERRKWIHCFDNVTAVIFVTAISEYDQVLYEDENTNRMDEALVLFDQICNHPSFKKTSMILFLNKRDLFEAKLAKKDLTCWEDNGDTRSAGKDYDKCITYIKKRFLEKNKDPQVRQVYVHATCATDTNNIAFVMESVFDIILKDNLRKMAKADISKLVDTAPGASGETKVKTEDVYTLNKAGNIILAVAWYTETLTERKVMVVKGANGELPAVQLETGLDIEKNNWEWIMGLGKDLPELPYNTAEAGSFKGNFKDGMKKLRLKLGGRKDLGSMYDKPIKMQVGQNHTTMLVAVRKLPKSDSDSDGAFPPEFEWVEHEVFENACYKQFAGIDTDKEPCKPPPKGEEFNPFAPNPVHHRWFKGITLFNAQVEKTPDKGVYLGVFKVHSSTTGFKIMVNEHNRISIPMIFLTENQLNQEEEFWMYGVRTREEMFGIDLLEGAKPNLGWLGPEMSGEDGATFKEKLWWAIDEAKARLDTQDIGKQYDRELLYIDEDDKIQLLLFGVLAKGADDLLPGHIWVDKEEFEVQNMKYMCPTVLQAMIHETQEKIVEYQTIAAESDASDFAAAQQNRMKKDNAREAIEKLVVKQVPLKWVNRVIMWCADKMPSFSQGLPKTNPTEVVKQAIGANSEIDSERRSREMLIKEYKGKASK